MEPKIDIEFASLIPPLTDDELAQLEKNLLAEGCRDALVVWGETLVDGHNRLNICEKHDIPYLTVARDFEDRDDAMRYIIQNQFGRRNLTIYDRGLLAIKLEPLYRPQAKENQRQSPGRGKKGFLHGENLFQSVNTQKEVAKIAGISPATVARIKTINEKGTPEQAERIQKGGSGNSVRAIYDEIQGKEPPAPVPPVGTQPPDSGTKAETPEEHKASLARIRGIVADLKNPNLDRSLTPDMFLMEYKAFMEQTLRNLEAFEGGDYAALYPVLKTKERKKLVLMSEAIIKAVRYNITLCGGTED